MDNLLCVNRSTDRFSFHGDLLEFACVDDLLDVLHHHTYLLKGVEQWRRRESDDIGRAEVGYDAAKGEGLLDTQGILSSGEGDMAAKGGK